MDCVEEELVRLKRQLETERKEYESYKQQEQWAKKHAEEKYQMIQRVQKQIKDLLYLN